MTFGAESGEGRSRRGECADCGGSRETERDIGLGKEYLPEHFVHPSSAMHVWLGRQLDAMVEDRGTKINVIGPRGSAKSTVVDVLLRVASGAGRLGSSISGSFPIRATRRRFTWIICGMS